MQGSGENGCRPAKLFCWRAIPVNNVGQTMLGLQNMRSTNGMRRRDWAAPESIARSTALRRNRRFSDSRPQVPRLLFPAGVSRPTRRGPGARPAPRATILRMLVGWRQRRNWRSSRSVLATSFPRQWKSVGQFRRQRPAISPSLREACDAPSASRSAVRSTCSAGRPTISVMIGNVRPLASAKSDGSALDSLSLYDRPRPIR